MESETQPRVASSRSGACASTMSDSSTLLCSTCAATKPLVKASSSSSRARNKPPSVAAPCKDCGGVGLRCHPSIIPAQRRRPPPTHYLGVGAGEQLANRGEELLQRHEAGRGRGLLGEHGQRQGGHSLRLLLLGRGRWRGGRRAGRVRGRGLEVRPARRAAVGGRRVPAQQGPHGPAGQQRHETLRCVRCARRASRARGGLPGQHLRSGRRGQLEVRFCCPAQPTLSSGDMARISRSTGAPASTMTSTQSRDDALLRLKHEARLYTLLATRSGTCCAAKCSASRKPLSSLAKHCAAAKLRGGSWFGGPHAAGAATHTHTRAPGVVEVVGIQSGRERGKRAGRDELHLGVLGLLGLHDERVHAR
jgi:hypothetical protein